LTDLWTALFPQSHSGDLQLIMTFDGQPRVRWTGQAPHGAARERLQKMWAWDDFADVMSSANLLLPEPIVRVSDLRTSTEVIRHRIAAPASDMDRYRKAFMAAMISAGGTKDYVFHPFGNGVEMIYPDGEHFKAANYAI